MILSLAHLGSIADNPKGIATNAHDNASGIAVLLEASGTLSNGALVTITLYCMFPDEKRRLADSKDLSKSDGLLAHN
jgi:hypothetical protein